MQRRYGPVANFKHEIDRVDYIRYFFTGCIFEVEERNLSCGNRTMFSIPTNLGVTKRSDENFYFMFDPDGDMLKYKGIYIRFALILHYLVSFRTQTVSWLGLLLPLPTAS